MIGATQVFVRGFGTQASGERIVEVLEEFGFTITGLFDGQSDDRGGLIESNICNDNHLEGDLMTLRAAVFAVAPPGTFIQHRTFRLCDEGEAHGPADDDDAFLRDVEELFDGETAPRPEWAPKPTPESLARKASLFERLRELGVATVCLEFDGYAGSGSVDAIHGLRGDGSEALLPEDLREALERYTLSRLPDGWQLDEGACGEVEFDGEANLVWFDFNRRVVETENEQWEE